MKAASLFCGRFLWLLATHSAVNIINKVELWKRASEWITDAAPAIASEGNRSSIMIEVPSGALRIVEIE